MWAHSIWCSVAVPLTFFAAFGPGFLGEGKLHDARRKARLLWDIIILVGVGLLVRVFVVVVLLRCFFFGSTLFPWRKESCSVAY